MNLIVESDKSKIQTVIFKDSQLIGIPQEIFDNFQNLKVLEINKGSVKNINILKNCSNLTEFRFIDVSSYKVLNSAFKNCQNILSINFNTFNMIMSVEPGSFYGLNNLENLIISARIEKVPENLFDSLFNLKTLVLRRDISEIPEFLFKNLRNLVEIGLSNNKFDTITEKWFENLTNLRKIQILGSGTALMISERAFSSQTKLSELDLRSSKIENIDFVQNLDSVQILNLNENKIANIKTLGSCKVSVLILTSNPIGKIDPKIFENCTSLKEINLERTQIQDLNNQTFAHLKNLEYLWISGNQQLTKIPNGLLHNNRKLKRIGLEKFSDQFVLPHDTFQNNLQLERLEIVHSNLTEISSNLIKNNVRLTDVNFFENHIMRIGSRFLDYLPNLLYLNLKENVCVNYYFFPVNKNLTYVRKHLEPCLWEEVEGNCRFELTDLGYTCVVREFTSDSFVASGNHLAGKLNSDVKAVKFEESALDSIPEEIFVKFNNLKHLDVHATGVQNFGALENCGNLESLNLNSNNLKILPTSTFYNCLKLKSIDLSQNDLEKIQDGLFNQNLYLEIINLSYNRIRAIEPCNFLKNLRYLKEIKLTENICVSRDFLIENQSDFEKMTLILSNCFGNWYFLLSKKL